MFLAHFTGSGLNDVLNLDTDDFFDYLDEAIELYRQENETPRRVVLAGIEQ
ncbi:hypothetical protein [uncultured Rikenella sp.]|uniref:hypothetical protein n=1 Tax=uncultured Rikenella sp. TaxID=368003 RepID=UPI0025CF482C|nr:hypothetical protein [uncultured Rikenella sp.]